MIAGVDVEIGREAVVVLAKRLLTVLSSAVADGGFVPARAIVNLHVPKSFRCEDTERSLQEFARRRELAPPWVGLLTAAPTERAETATEKAGALTALAVVTVGLSNPVSAGLSGPAAWAPSTINTILIVDANPEPAALVNLVMTVTEAKTLVLTAAGVRTEDGARAGGTSTDAVAIAATGCGPRCRFGGPISELGWVAARAARRALEAGVGRWLEEHG